MLTLCFSVSSLVSLAGIEGDKPSFESLLLQQIETLRKQLDKSDLTTHGTGLNAPAGRSARVIPPSPAVPPPNPRNSHDRDMRALLDTLSQKVSRFNPNSLFESNSRPNVQHPVSSTNLQENANKVDPFSNLGIILDSLPTTPPPLEANPAYLRPTSTGYQVDTDSNTKTLLDRIAQRPITKAPETSTGFYYSQGVEPYQVPSGSAPYFTPQMPFGEPRGTGTFADSFGGLL